MAPRIVLLAGVIVLATVGGPIAGLASGDDVALEIVVETPDGDPVDEATVTATWDGGSDSGETSSNGRVFIDVPEGEDVSIEIEHEEYVRNRPYEVSDASAAEVAITVWEKASASVTVDDDDGPVEDVRVAFRKSGDFVAAHRTDEQGVVDSGVIEAGEYSLRVSKTGYFRETVTLDVENDTAEEVTIERGSVSVGFTALDDHFDPPEPIAEATIEGADFSTVTQHDGQRSVSLPVNAELSVTLRKDGYETVEASISVGETDMAANVTTRRTPAVNVELSNERVVVGETVEVTVTDEYGDPTNATVSIDGSSVGAVDEAGSLRVPIESRGEHTVSATVGELSSEEATVTGVQPGDDGTPDTETETLTATVTAESEQLIAPSLRSMAIGLAGGLVLAAVLFIVIRFR